MYNRIFTHFSVEGHWYCFQLLAIMNKAIMNIVDQKVAFDQQCHLWVYARVVITRSWGRQFLRTWHIDFLSECANLHFHQQWRTVPLAPDIFQHELLLCQWAILTRVRWNILLGVLICLYLMNRMSSLSLMFLHLLTFPYWDFYV